jgi:mRNA-decapping enzyme subunit 2
MSLRSFCLRIFQHCPLLAPFSAENHMRAFEEFMQYKTRVPVRGAILLNEAMDSTVLVKGWKKGANWSFPRGKINKDEDDLDCAIREVYEETGFDIKKAGLVPRDDEVKYIQIVMREQQIRLYVFRNIPMDTVFEPKTRKEISKVEWYKLSELPAFRKKGSTSHDDVAAATNANKFYMVAPFLVPLKKWVGQQHKRDGARTANNSHLAAHAAVDEPLTEDDLGAQTEPVAPASNGAPAIETMEGATRELQRLLNIQPPAPAPTHDLQTNPPALSEDKGEALMALLMKGAGLPSQQGLHQQPQQPQQPRHPQASVPHTPLDLTYVNAPQPHTPHHHHAAQRLPVPNYQPPPNFPIPPSSIQNPSAGYLRQAQPPAQVLPQAYGRNPFVNPGQQQQQHRPEPVLLHPQPLPPQVHQSVITRGILPTPGLPDMAGQGAPHPQQGVPHAQHGGPQVQQGAPNPFAPRRNDGFAAPQQAGKPGALTGHAMSLLNAFKAGPRDAESKPHGNTPQDTPPLPAGHQRQYQPAPWTGAPTTQPPNPAAQYLQHHMAPVAPTGASPRTIQPLEGPSGSKPTQLAESHRTALLDMFKKSGPKSPLSNELRMQPGKIQQTPGFTRKDELVSPAYKAPSAAEAIASASEANGAPVMMNPEVNLPYRAVQILSRPKQAESTKSQDAASAQAQMQRLQRRLSPLGSSRHESRNAGRQGLTSPRERAFFHQMEPEAKKSPQLNYAAAHAASLPYAQQSPSNTHSVPSLSQQQQPTGVLQRRKDSNPEQKQKLLSLFSKEQQQASPAVFPAEEKGKGKEPAAFDQPGSGTPRSRVASFASATGNEPAVAGSAATSRRGSQTPISPADRSFLFSYLESVTNSGR